MKKYVLIIINNRVSEIYEVGTLLSPAGTHCVEYSLSLVF